MSHSFDQIDEVVGKVDKTGNEYPGKWSIFSTVNLPVNGYVWDMI